MRVEGVLDGQGVQSNSSVTRSNSFSVGSYSPTQTKASPDDRPVRHSSRASEKSSGPSVRRPSR